MVFAIGLLTWNLSIEEKIYQAYCDVSLLMFLSFFTAKVT